MRRVGRMWSAAGVPSIAALGKNVDNNPAREEAKCWRQEVPSDFVRWVVSGLQSGRSPADTAAHQPRRVTSPAAQSVHRAPPFGAPGTLNSRYL